MENSLLELYLDELDLTYFELSEAFRGLSDANVWKRPSDELLSIGEIAGHISFWLALRLASDKGAGSRDFSGCHVLGPLIDPTFAYYTSNRNERPKESLLKMSAAEVWTETERVYKEVSAYLRGLNPDIDTGGPEFPEGDTYRQYLKYLIFHVSYHTGQIYSHRHLLGETTPDN